MGHWSGGDGTGRGVRRGCTGSMSAPSIVPGDGSILGGRGTAWREGCEILALLPRRHQCHRLHGLPGIGTGCRVACLMPARPGPPACPWAFTLGAWHVPAQASVPLRGTVAVLTAMAVPCLARMACQPGSRCCVLAGHPLGSGTARGALSGGGSRQAFSLQPDKGLFVPAAVGLAPQGREWPLLPCCLPPGWAVQGWVLGGTGRGAGLAQG